ncbi:hypothetical protein J437_LFUL014944 [Ladona fulva]|uniref:AAA+ ATPase domain-containing protein n=1 Tax=Ladona fulva TaxID=123851 RepID=A0A8K0P811_LADFU|nr:hypothetical protein J437_LFUL014944 [Ladona fulva]
MNEPEGSDGRSSSSICEEEQVDSPWKEVLDQLIVRHPDVNVSHSEALPFHIPHKKVLEEPEPDVDLVEPVCIKIIRLKRVVPYSQLDKSHFFTISQHGVTEFSKSEILWTPLDSWEKEYDLYNKLMQINIFKYIHFVVTYYWWRKNISLYKFHSTRKKLTKILFMLNEHFRKASLKYHEICYPLKVMSFIQFSDQLKFELQELVSTQEKEVAQMHEKLSSLQDYLKDFIISSCHSALASSGYTIDDNYYMMDLLRCIMYNSVNALLSSLSKHSLNELPKEELPISNTNQPETSEKIAPIFDLDILIDANCIYFSPSKEEFFSNINMILDKWAETVTSIQPLLDDELSDPFTTPMINGRTVERLCGSGPCLASVLIDDDKLCNLRREIINILEYNFAAAYVHTELLEKIRIFYAENEKTQYEDIEKETDPDFFKSMIGKTKIGALTTEVTDAIAFLEISPRTTLDFVEYLEFLDKASTRVEEMEHELEYVKSIYDIIEDYVVPCSADDVANYLSFGMTLTTLRNIIEAKISDKGNIIALFNDQLNKDITSLIGEVSDINCAISQPMLVDINSNPEEVKLILTELDEKLQEIKKRANQFKGYQQVIKMEITKYDILEEAIANVHLRQLLWESVEVWYAQVEEWTSQDFHTLNHENMSAFTAKHFKYVNQLEKDLPENLIVPKWRESVERIKGKLPVIAYLRNPALKHRHWMNIEHVLGYKFKPDETLTISLLDELNAFSKKSELEEISGQASSEAGLEAILKKFIVLPYKDTKDVYMLGGVEEVQNCLDDSSINISTVASSKHAGPIKQRVDNWIINLDLFSKTLDEWLSCQQGWLYLEPIFSAPDIQRQLPSESRMFLTVDKSWKGIMRDVNKVPLAMQTCLKPGLLETFQLNNNLLDQIMKCLEAYLESKRVIFPRFYFLSNDELIEILAQAKNPHAVQPHLRKCFDAIARLEFGKRSPESASSVTLSVDITGMISSENESVEFVKGVRARGNVEEWLSKVEDSMFMSLKKCMKIAIYDFSLKDSRRNWIMSHPSQVILTVSQIMWSQDVHVILESNDVENELIIFEKKCFRDLNDLAAMVRRDIPKLLRAVLCALITIDVHARDIITIMVENKVTSSLSFEWLKQLRYYWDEDEETVFVKMSSSVYEYGYEYLGASPRLVITPLTDRCYLCLMGALQLDLGGAPAGPAGTGKTETTKDLAKSIAILCVVFNCSEGLDYKAIKIKLFKIQLYKFSVNTHSVKLEIVLQMMGRFFSGLAQAGAWCCFDEFNRIDIEVLSVIAQQLITIKNAKSQKLSRFLFEGREIKLSHQCSAFITMNPGYAGRTELPDNLKALFRPISMMVPDYGTLNYLVVCRYIGSNSHVQEDLMHAIPVAMIAEVILYSEGFETSKELARKMTQMYKLCSEQLSQQDHYDFGMRAVKSVLVMAGFLKRENPDKSEDVVLIRALRDSNLPKFLADDVLLFQGILSDLFPGVEIPHEDYGILQTTIQAVLNDKGLQVIAPMVKKVIQLYETMIVRHGVMLVGTTGSGKTTIYKTYVLNPKSVTLGELYGEIDPATFEWHDGLLGIMVRAATQVTDEIHQWIICDGPVDAVWIENMNTVLDDNKMLCLANSERIKLTPWIHMVFEVQDLAQASPATVSRCGMVYVDAKEIRWMPYFETWLSKIPDGTFTKPYLNNLVSKYVDEGFNFVQRNCTYPIEQVELGKISMMCSILDWFTDEYIELESSLDPPRLGNFITQTFIIAYLWSVGGSLKESHQDKFEVYVREQFEEHPDARLPSSNDLWSYYMNFDTRRLELWQKLTPKFVYDSAVPFFEIQVPTVDTVRYGYIIEKLLLVKKPVLCTGMTGVGKTVIAKNVLKRLYDSGEFVTASLNFSAQTSSKRIQEIIELKLEKKKKNLLGGPPGKRVIIFIDDVNMPTLDTYGAQPAIELLRQFLDFGGMFDREKLFWKSIVDVVLTAACAPPGGGRNPLTPRFSRHFAMLNIQAPSEMAMKHIFRSILWGFFTNFNAEIQEMTDAIVGAAIDIYECVCEELLPTPAKSHYVYNLRDLSKCFQGILQANPGSIREKEQISRLFYHESLRVFHDRLTNIEDQEFFYRQMKEIFGRYFYGITLPPIEDDEGNFRKPWLMFGDFMYPSVDRAERIYEEITDVNKLKAILQEYLDEYNMSSKIEMNLVFFLDALEHIARIARILRSERGNALLIGVGGMGKQSLTRLGAQLCGFKCFMIELTKGYDYNSFHEDLRKLFKNAGVKNENNVFLFVDTQIVVEEFLEDINNMLNSGEVPHLFEGEEYELVIQGARAAAKEHGIADGNRDSIFDYFTQRVRKNLHLVICMSPVGDSFRSRCRMFPSLVNCCSIDWFFEWPQEALLSVAINSLGDINNEELRGKLASTCVFMHEKVSKATEIFYSELRRRYYVTPGSYLEFIRLYLSMLNNKTDEIKKLKDRVHNGLTKLQETNELVAKMKVELIALEPELNKKNAATEILMKNLAKEQSEADKVRKVVVADEAVVKIKAEETQTIAADAQKDLDEALPAMEAAQKALNALDKNDIKEVRVFNKPPHLVKFVMEAVCLLLGAKTDWGSAKIVLGDTNFLKRLQEYDKDSISDALLRKLKEYVDNPNFVPDLVESHSKACKSLCMWVRAIDCYAKIYRVVQPKRKRLQAAEEELNQVMTVLREKQKRLAEVEAQIAQLEAAYDTSMAEKLELERIIELTATRLHRAGRLITALGDEETRWEQLVKNFGIELGNVVGNVLISAAFVTYLGAFTNNYRQELMESWIKQCSDLGIPVSKDYSVINVLADPFEIRQWNTFGLPRDAVSTENGILVTHTQKWPLMIDPQEQASTWIRHMEAENNLRRIKSTTPNLVKILEGCINVGIPVLIEEVDEVLEPSLDTLLQKHTFKQAGRLLIRFGDTDIEYDENFRFYMTTKLSNPHFLPEVCIKVTVINFTVTHSGLDEQLLSDVVRLERPELEKERIELITRINNDKKQLKGIEEKILKLLFTSEGNILDDEELVDTLNESKETAAIIATRLQQSEVTEEKISVARNKYRPVSVRGSVMYSVVAKLGEIDPMYQYSLKYFSQVFNSVIETTNKSPNLDERLEILLREITKSIYINISKGLFERHKLVFSFMLCVEILLNSGKISSEGVNFLLRGPLSTNSELPKKPESTAITDSMWNSVNFLEDNFNDFADLRKNVERRIMVNIGDFEQVIHLLPNITSNSAVEWDKKLRDFEKLMLLKAMKEEKLVFGITQFVKENLGKVFIESPPVNLNMLYQDTSNVTPLIFILTTGSDPFSSFQRFAQDMGFQDKIHSISLGQGQGPVAEKLINLAVQRGEWNCHLATSWMAPMEQIIVKLAEEPDKVHGSFRLFMSSMPSTSFPVSVLQNSVKVTTEAPKGLRANLSRALTDLDHDFFEDNGKQFFIFFSLHVLEEKWRKLVFGICFFHAVIQERKKFGPLAWNIVYEFNDSDRECALNNLKMFCSDGNIPWDALEYITGEITYGGRVTDIWDQRCLTTVLKIFFSPQTLSKGYKYSHSGIYYCPELEKLDEFRDFVQQFPIIEEPEVFRMHANANLIHEKNETQGIIRTINEIQPRGEISSHGIPPDEIVYNMSQEIRNQLPDFIQKENCHPEIMQHDSEGRLLSLATVVLQEVDRFNKLLDVIHESLIELQKAINGLVKFNFFIMVSLKLDVNSRPNALLK